MMTTSSTAEQLSDRLYTACEEYVACLGELRGIHLEIDPPTRTIAPNDPECVYRMRKVLLHVSGIVGWQLNTTVMHVMAPEIRAAIEQLDTVWDEAVRAMDLDDLNKPAELLTWYKKTSREFLSSYVHPTPQRLLAPMECGGLGPENRERYYALVAMVLVDLASRYAALLEYLARLSEVEKEQDIISVFARISKTEALYKNGSTCARMESHQLNTKTSG